MSIQWTLVAAFLYIELAVVAILLAPFLKPRTSYKFFKSRFLRSLESQSNLYFMVFIVILILLFLDSIREMAKYSGELKNDMSSQHHVDTETLHSMKLFRAQRNFYIAGFALFLFPVIRRLVTVLSNLAQLEIQVEATMKQAKGAADAAKNLFKDGKSSDGDKSTSTKESEKLAARIKELEKELTKEKSSQEALKKQAENLTQEYDRLQAEHKKMMKKQKVEGDSKKDN